MTDITSIFKSGNSANRVDIVIVAEGYIQFERSKFISDVNNFVQYLFSSSNKNINDPFLTYKSFLNIDALFVASQQSGYSTDSQFKNTAFNAKAYLADGRLVYGDESKVNSIVNSSLSASQGEIRLVFINSNNYGGAGGSVAWVTSGNKYSYDIALHEIGHSYAGLEDEYVDLAIANNYPLSNLYNSVHVSTTSDPNLVPWRSWLGYQDDLGTVGIYQGGYYRDSGVWRATLTSKMNSLNLAFSAPQKEAFIKKFYETVGEYSNLSQKSLLDFIAVTPDADLFKYQWKVDGKVSSLSGSEFSILDFFNSKADGVVSIRIDLKVSDNSGLIRDPSILALSTKDFSKVVTATKISLGENQKDYFGNLNGNAVIFGNKQSNHISVNLDLTSQGYISAGDGNDRISLSNGNYKVDGGNGIDTLIFSTKMSSYMLSKNADNNFQLVKPTLNREENISFISIERLKFLDTNIAVDIAPSQNAGSVYMLYKAAFNRPSDAGGMGYWIAQMDGGANIVTNIAQGFVNSAEFIAKYGSNPSNASYVNNLYQNVLGRAGEAGGVAYWTGEMDAGRVSKAQALVQFATLPEGAGIVAPIIANGIQYQEWLG